MSKTLSNFILIVFISFLFINCANRGTPEGGPKDLEPPVIVSAEPKNFSTNFNAKEIKIYFNEYIKINNLQKQLIISPPMKTQPEITPLGGASKYITIKIFDTLQPNTTYAFNFGNSIQDNNEGNPYPYFRYVFSTGDYIDSLSVQGTIFDAEKRKPETFVSVMLYEVDSTFNDSIIYKETPKYITNTLDSTTTFSIDNVKEGKYLLVALKDNNNDNIFQQKTDKIGYHKSFITVPTDSLYNLTLFTEDINFDAVRPRLVTGEKIAFGYEGDYNGMQITLKSNVPDTFEYRITKDPTTDTLNYWYKPKLEMDSLVFNIQKGDFNKDYTVFLKDNKKDTLTIGASPGGNIEYEQPFNIFGSVPFQTIDSSKIKITDKDTIEVAYTTAFDTIANTLSLNFNKTEANTYNINILPEAFTDFFGHKNDSLSYTTRTQSLDKYGNHRIVLVNHPDHPLIVQLTTEQEEMKYELYSKKEGDVLDFVNILPGKYIIKIIFDKNGNGVYDTGNYLKGIQPEESTFFNLDESIRADWNTIQTIQLIKR
ncbi:Ig-like domain-containing protein [Flavobacteriaceae bacterium XHP0103]|uniref:Ig-like domain-containing protein n=1 Tax=Marixanthotalea marina TaxID=2844359 RepID=UPI002989B5D7|nr:Ig-like domain-containing protein [Marixanthotalea marina]MBU3822111.1 Ig-like domain-containing protein [Marixanthotalea marina]